jgi:putative membrane protein
MQVIGCRIKEESRMMYGYGWAWLMMLWMGASAIFCLAALGLIVWLLVRWLDPRRAGARNLFSAPPEIGPTAQEILRPRYARGEIDATTYEQMRERLGA